MRLLCGRGGQEKCAGRCPRWPTVVRLRECRCSPCAGARSCVLRGVPRPSSSVCGRPTRGVPPRLWGWSLADGGAPGPPGTTTHIPSTCGAPAVAHTVRRRSRPPRRGPPHGRTPRSRLPRGAVMKHSRGIGGPPTRLFGRRLRGVAAVSALVVVMAMLGALPAATAAPVNPGPVGNGFVVTPGDLAFILKQIKIAERHTTTLTASNLCGTLLNQPGDNIPDAEQVPDILTSYGLRTVNGACNNLKNDTTKNFAASDQVFPRLTTPVWRPAEPPPPGFPTSTPTYQGTGNVVDSQPRTVSNLIDDQTSTNPAAVAAAEFPVRTQAKQGASAIPCAAGSTTTPVGCTPSHKTLFIPNITTDVGLSPPYNSLFTFFGQFFDHGVDQTVK